MKEKCVLCETDTGIPIDTRIDYRLYYVEGVGQLCKECWNRTYNNDVEEKDKYLQTR